VQNFIREARREKTIWSRQENNIRGDLRETQCEIVDCIYMAQERDHWRAPVNMVMFEKYGEYLD
jgi:hypothetical protein